MGRLNLLSTTTDWYRTGTTVDATPTTMSISHYIISSLMNKTLRQTPWLKHLTSDPERTFHSFPTKNHSVFGFWRCWLSSPPLLLPGDANRTTFGHTYTTDSLPPSHSNSKVRTKKLQTSVQTYRQELGGRVTAMSCLYGALKLLIISKWECLYECRILSEAYKWLLTQCQREKTSAILEK